MSGRRDAAFSRRCGACNRGNALVRSGDGRACRWCKTPEGACLACGERPPADGSTTCDQCRISADMEEDDVAREATPAAPPRPPRARRKPEDPDERTLADMFAVSVKRSCEFMGERLEAVAPGRVRVHFADGSYAEVALPIAFAGDSVDDDSGGA